MNQTHQTLFPDQPLTPAGHFWLYSSAAILHIIQQVARQYDTWDAMYDEFPFLAEHNNQIVHCGVQGLAPEAALRWWYDAICVWEGRISTHLPLRTLRDTAGLSHQTLTLLFAIGLIEEHAQFGRLFEAMQDTPGAHRPTLGLLQNWWHAAYPDSSDVRESFQQLERLGLIEVINPGAPRGDLALGVPLVLWDALRGVWRDTDSVHYGRAADAPTFDDLILDDTQRATLTAFPALLATGRARTLLVRGARHNGRKTLLRAIARTAGKGTLTFDSKAEAAQRSTAGSLAVLLNAIPIFEFDLTAGECIDLPATGVYDGLIGLVLGKQGGISSTEQMLTVNLEIPDPQMRHEHWTAMLGGSAAPETIDLISERFRLTSGNLRRTAQLAVTYAQLAGRSEVTSEDVIQASRSLNRQALETLAVHEPTTGDWNQLATAAETLYELTSLETRCRHRERLQHVLGRALGLHSGVRALFSGPSGTGKTLAARLLAASLGMELYRLDLSAVVNKYIGETEKNLNQVFSRAEELDVVLLIDEGDALLTRRTDVQNANDRYANLETNFLLQRLEAYEGIVIITTNASDRVDSAFQRRMDVIVEFHLPEAAERWSIWQLHLPPDHRIDQRMLQEVASRCTFSGGQIRNAVLHAAMLALEAGSTISTAHLVAAAQREYRKIGQSFPLRRGQNGV